ncbi:hypothetical protein [Listeria marthii]
MRADLTKAYEFSKLETVCASCHSRSYSERNVKISYKKTEGKNRHCYFS